MPQSRIEKHPDSRATSAWTAEREAMACRLYLDEGLTASEVARALGGVSRAAVIGKINRLGHSKRTARRGGVVAASHLSRPRRRKREWTPRLEPCWPPQPLPPLREAPLQGPPARLAVLGPCACRWPIDDPGPGRMDAALFCAAPTMGQTYCPAHSAIARPVRSSPSGA
jgi:GcrA cell cycle regulator